MKLKKLVKQAVKKPSLFSEQELKFFKNWLYKNKKHKPKK